jgi:hypothetical protein
LQLWQSFTYGVAVKLGACANAVFAQRTMRVQAGQNGSLVVGG